jgi:hypothetical protein
MNFYPTIYRFEAAKIISKPKTLGRRFMRALRAVFAHPTKRASGEGVSRDINGPIERSRPDSSPASADAILNRATLHFGQRGTRMR